MANYDRTVVGAIDLNLLHRKELASMSTLRQLKRLHPNAVIAFSGGKDSIVAAFLARRLGFSLAVCEESFCFTRQKADTRMIAKHLRLQVEYREILSWNFLSKSPKWIFPPLKEQGAMYGQRQQKSVKQYARTKGYEAIIYGRRTQENTVKSTLYSTKDWLVHCHPIRDWSTSEVWHFIRSHKLPYPDIYEHEIGMKEGNTPFVFVSPDNFPNPIKAVFDYEPAIVEKLAAFYKPAESFLNGH